MLRVMIGETLFLAKLQ